MSRTAEPIKFVDIDGLRLETGAEVEVTIRTKIYSVKRGDIEPDEIWVTDVYGNTYIVQSKHRSADMFRRSKEE